jgi:hypothetical protein
MMVGVDNRKRLPAGHSQSLPHSLPDCSGSRCVDISATHRDSTLGTLARTAVPDGARPIAPKSPSGPFRSALLLVGTHGPKAAHGSHMAIRRPPQRGEASPQQRSGCCQPHRPCVATRPRQPELTASEKVIRSCGRALEAFLHQRVRCSNHHFWRSKPVSSLGLVPLQDVAGTLAG